MRGSTQGNEMKKGTEMKKPGMKKLVLASTVLAGLLRLRCRMAADCDVTVGVVMELTGPAGEYGKAGAKSVEMAFRDFNEAAVPTAAKF